MRSQDEIAAIADAMNGGIVWNQAKYMFPDSIYEGLDEDEQMDKAVERWIELCRRLGYTFKRSTFVGNMSRRYVRIVCKGERGEVAIKQSQSGMVVKHHEHWDIAVYVDGGMAYERHDWGCIRVDESAYLIDMMCEYVGCARRTESML